ncbi:hypothetical protein LX32DRAFT_273534 [Colletotrichum zoysiae]|uniref:Uncharacterized protein n=1 Tax=Colletotrichum zoysiae TaxID=1216348 RepID=A0AAD9HPA5_9PEZI|nr:hypothetical protein LX32DRAFT_273534 [Colletotrichum zoysiae]
MNDVSRDLTQHPALCQFEMLISSLSLSSTLPWPLVFRNQGLAQRPRISRFGHWDWPRAPCQGDTWLRRGIVPRIALRRRREARTRRPSAKVRPYEGCQSTQTQTQPQDQHLSRRLALPPEAALLQTHLVSQSSSAEHSTSYLPYFSSIFVCARLSLPLSTILRPRRGSRELSPNSLYPSKL